MAKRKQQEIIFNHIELDESVSPEFVKELHKLIAKRLFEDWRKWKESGGQGDYNPPTKPLTDNEFRDGVSGAQVKEKKSYNENEIKKEKSKENQN